MSPHEETPAMTKPTPQLDVAGGKAGGGRNSPATVLESKNALSGSTGTLITPEMLLEEQRLQKEREEQEEVERNRAASHQEKQLKESALGKLNALLDRTNAYSQFLVENMEAEIRVAAPKPAVKGEEGLGKRGDRQAKGKGGKGGGGRGRKPKRQRKEEGEEETLQQKISAASGSSAQATPATGEKGKEGEKEEEELGEEETEEERLWREQMEIAPNLIGGRLKSYQIKGIRWLISLWQNGLNGILADQMGLGKTVQTVGFLAHLKSHGLHGPFLVIAPLSTLSNWINEIQKWVPTSKVLLYHGNKEKRAELRHVSMPSEITADFPIIVTSYEMIIFDRKLLGKYRWKYVVVDEGHRLKNTNCLLLRELRQLPMDNSLLLTGTPLQNNLPELWSLLNFLLPKIFSSLEEFTSWFDWAGKQGEVDEAQVVAKERRAQVITKLHNILRPFLLRRLKEEVEISLPRKKEIILYAHMVPLQKEFHDLLVEKTLEQYLKAQLGDRAMNRSSLSRVFMQLRKNCNHPDLLSSKYDQSFEYPPVSALLEQCGKLQLLDRLLTKLKGAGHKVLLFSQMTRMLDILDYFLDERGFDPFRIDGSVKIEDRSRQIKDFNCNSDAFVFLLSTRAGGLGINLASADTVIIYDSDWNPHMDMQAMDRCHRIGQSRPVHVYRLVTAHSAENRMIAVANGKLKLETLVIEKGHFKQDKSMEAKELEESELLALLRPDESEKEDVVQSCDISEENLEKLMDRSDMEPGSTTKILPDSGPGWETVVPTRNRGSALSAIV